MEPTKRKLAPSIPSVPRILPGEDRCQEGKGIQLEHVEAGRDGVQAGEGGLRAAEEEEAEGGLVVHPPVGAVETSPA